MSAEPDSYLDQDALHERGLDAHIMRRLVGQVRPHAGLAAASLALVALATVFGLAMPYFLRLVVDDATASSDLARAWNLDGRGALLRWFAVLFLACELLRFANNCAQGYVLQLLGQRVVHDVRTDLFAHVHRLSLGFFHRQPVGRLVTRQVFDVDTLSELFSQALLTVVLDCFTILAIAVTLLVLDWRLGLFVLTVLPPMVGLTLLFRRVLSVGYREVARLRSALNAYHAESIGGAREIQAFNRQAKQLAEFDRRNDDLMVRRIGVIRLYSLFMPGFHVLSAIAQALVIVFIGGAVIRGELSAGLFGQFFFLVRMLVEPLRDLAEKYNVMQAASASADRIYKLRDEAPDPTRASPRDGAGVRARGAIEFRGVSFDYAVGLPVLADVSFAVAPGERVALVGHTGAGKTTLFHLLARHYDPTAGEVRLDGRPLVNVHPDDLRRQIALVQQEPFMFAGTIRSNIALGDAYTDAQVEAAARTVGADGFIETLPLRYSEPVVEAGATLSAGQRQLISFARAVLRDAPILLLDEATSSIDTRSEQLIQHALNKLLEGRTCLVIAHRLSTVQRCDRILVLEKGHLAEEGTHAQLLARRGLYRRLYELQYAERPAGGAGSA